MRGFPLPGRERSTLIGRCRLTYIGFDDHSGHQSLNHPGRRAPDRRATEMVTLEIADTFGAQQRRVLGVLDAFGHCG